MFRSQNDEFFVVYFQFKERNQPLKWDVFVGRKGGMNNTLAPVKGAAPVQTEPPRPAKLEAIPPGKREEPKDQHHQSQTHKTEERTVAPVRPTEVHSTTNNEQNKFKDLLKGKPIIFVGGGPGELNVLLMNFFIELILLSFQVVAKEHNVRK